VRLARAFDVDGVRGASGARMIGGAIGGASGVGPRGVRMGVDAFPSGVRLASVVAIGGVRVQVVRA
jgi:hypothetical protein